MPEKQPIKNPIAKSAFTQGSGVAKREETILKFWQENRIFEKSVNKTAPQGSFEKPQDREFIFYEGPPTANGKPGIHHLEARAFKDAIPRYKTMRGFKVRRKGGWDTHGLPVELQVEKELGLKSKKEIEVYGIEAFNKKCRESVWTYVKEWEEFTSRIGYWIDLKRPYVTYKPYYIESVWNIVSKINEQGLLYKDYKVVPWCPRCGTGLSSHELAQGYEDVKDLAVTVKFEIRSTKSETNSKSQIQNEGKTYLLAWTTTPWTLPGNVGLAVGEDIEYSLVQAANGKYIVASTLVGKLFTTETVKVLEEVRGASLVGLEYEPPFPFLKDALSVNSPFEKGGGESASRGILGTGTNPSPSETQGLPLGKGELRGEAEKLKNAFKIYAADFVTTTDGTGIVHTAVMYGTDDFELGTKVGLPKHHLVKEDGTFKEETGFLAGKFVKDPDTDVAIIKDLASRGLLFAKEKYAHSYPHCWRCHTPLIYYARDSWYIKMSALRDKLVAENEKINWEPEYIKDGRFGEWLREIKDWAISRERYWGTPLPVWECASCGKRKVVGSFSDLYEHGTAKKLTRLILVRHGESDKNVLGLFDSSKDKYPLTKEGEDRAKLAGEKVKGMNVDAIYASPVLRTRQTAEIIGKAVGRTPVLSDALWEVRSGEWDGKKDAVTEAEADRIAYNKLPHDLYYKAVRGKTGESWQDVENRAVAFVREILKKHQGETVVLVSHEGPLMTLMRYFKDLSLDDITNLWEESRTFHAGLLGGYAEPTSVYVDNRTGKEIDPHRPFIDEFTLACECKREMKRVKEVMDVWFDSGAMPFAEEHYPFKNKELIDGAGYPADFISEAIDQTRGWFYTLHAIGTLMGKGAAYKNVICLGHILDAEGKKMSKSIGNVVDPNLMIEKYGADALRFWMYSVNQPGEPKNFDEKSVDEIVKKVFNLAGNVLAFYELYAENVYHEDVDPYSSSNALDQWILALTKKLVCDMTKSLDAYKLLEPTRAIRDFIADLSQWYLRRSRNRIKSEDVSEDQIYALATTRFVLETLAKVMSPFTPFFAEYLYQRVKYINKKESVHLEEWPSLDSTPSHQAGPDTYGWEFKIKDPRILEKMIEVRRVVSLALEQRAKANIKVRQPLASLKLKSKILNLKSEVSDLIKDEVNVKEIIFDDRISGEVELDTTITPELKEEGDVRELIRAIQEFRKEMKLSPSDVISLSVETDKKGRKFLEKYKAEFRKVTLVRDFVFESAPSGHSVVSGDFSFVLKIIS